MSVFYGGPVLLLLALTACLPQAHIADRCIADAYLCSDGAAGATAAATADAPSAPAASAPSASSATAATSAAAAPSAETCR